MRVQNCLSVLMLVHTGELVEGADMSNLDSLSAVMSMLCFCRSREIKTFLELNRCLETLGSFNAESKVEYINFSVRTSILDN